MCYFLASTELELSDIFGNIYHYYVQFKSLVSKSIRESLTTVEKELKVSQW